MSYQPHIPNKISTTSFNSRDAATLAKGASFQGVGEDVSAYGRVGVSITSTNQSSGTLFMQVSRDNVNWGGPPRKVSDTRFKQPNMWNIVERYFRILYVNNGVEAQGLVIQTQYSNNSDILLGHELDEELRSETEAIVTRSVIVGKDVQGRFHNAHVDKELRLQTHPQEVVDLLKELIDLQTESNRRLKVISGEDLL